MRREELPLACVGHCVSSVATTGGITITLILMLMPKWWWWCGRGAGIPQTLPASVACALAAWLTFFLATTWTNFRKVAATTILVAARPVFLVVLAHGARAEAALHVGRSATDTGPRSCESGGPCFLGLRGSWWLPFRAIAGGISLPLLTAAPARLCVVGHAEGMPPHLYVCVTLKTCARAHARVYLPPCLHHGQCPCHRVSYVVLVCAGQRA